MVPAGAGVDAARGGCLLDAAKFPDRAGRWQVGGRCRRVVGCKNEELAGALDGSSERNTFARDAADE